MSTTLPPWDELSFSFNPSIPDGVSSIPQCRVITFSYWDEVGTAVVADPPVTLPFSLEIYGGGSEPLLIPINNTAPQGNFKWAPNLPVGTEFAISMKDAKGYTAGILTPTFTITAGTGCNLSNPMKPSSLDVALSGTSQCGQAIFSLNNGTAPYTVEVVPINGQQKTIHFASSPFSVVLDMGEGIQYFMAVYDSAGHSTVKGPYTVGPSTDNSCLGAATTVTAGQFSTLYPGGTAAAVSSATATASATTTPTPAGAKLASPAIISMAVGIPAAVLILAALLLWICYKRNRQRRNVDSGERLEIDHFDGYTPVATYAVSPNAHSGSHCDISNPNTPQHIPVPVPHPHPMDASNFDRHMMNTVEGSSMRGYDRSGTLMSEKRRQLFNPNLQSLNPEPFDPYIPAEPTHGTSAQPAMPPLPPAYRPS